MNEFSFTLSTDWKHDEDRQILPTSDSFCHFLSHLLLCLIVPEVSVLTGASPAHGKPKMPDVPSAGAVPWCKPDESLLRRGEPLRRHVMQHRPSMEQRPPVQVSQVALPFTLDCAHVHYYLEHDE